MRCDVGMAYGVRLPAGNASRLRLWASGHTVHMSALHLSKITVSPVHGCCHTRDFVFIEQDWAVYVLYLAWD